MLAGKFEFSTFLVDFSKLHGRLKDKLLKISLKDKYKLHDIYRKFIGEFEKHAPETGNATSWRENLNFQIF